LEEHALQEPFRNLPAQNTDSSLIVLPFSMRFHYFESY